MANAIRKSGEDYLEKILMLEEITGPDSVHAVEVAKSLGVSKASVSKALKKLKEEGYLSFGPHEVLSLSETGRSLASKTYEKHRFLGKLLMSLGVDEKTSYEDACRLEHDLSEKSFLAIKKAYGIPDKDPR